MTATTGAWHPFLLLILMIAANSPETKSWNPDPFASFVEDALKILQGNTWSIFDSVKNSCTYAPNSQPDFTRMRYWRTIHETRGDVVIYPLTEASTKLCLDIHRYVSIIRMSEIKRVLVEFGMDKWGKKGDLTQRLTNKLMIVHYIPGRETFDRLCQTIDQLLPFSPHYRRQLDYPFKLNSDFHHDMSIPFESLVKMSKNTECNYRLHDCFNRLRDMTPAILCSLAYGRWITFTLSNTTVQAGISWKIVFTRSNATINTNYRYDIKVNGRQVLLIATQS